LLFNYAISYAAVTYFEIGWEDSHTTIAKGRGSDLFERARTEENHDNSIPGL